MKLIRYLVLAIIFSSGGAALAGGAPKPISTETGTVSGVLTYASMQYWIQSGKEVFCVMYDEKDEDHLMPLDGKKVTFTGLIQTWSSRKMKRCIVVGPNYPKEVK